MGDWAAIGYAALAGGAVVFHLCMILGAPWGRLTMGGRSPGVLPPAMRLASFASALLIGAMALAILSTAGMWPGWPAWTGTAALALTALSCVMNWATPSRPERMLWGPVTTGMLVFATVAVFWAP